MSALERAIEAQKRYYDLRAPDYLTDAPSDRREHNRDQRLNETRWRAIIDDLHPTGNVLELACGPGGFTRELARHAASVTAVDASPQMLAPASQTAGESRSSTRTIARSTTTTSGCATAFPSRAGPSPTGASST